MQHNDAERSETKARTETKKRARTRARCHPIPDESFHASSFYKTYTLRLNKSEGVFSYVYTYKYDRDHGGGFYSSRVADRQAKSSAWPSWRDGTGKYQYVHVEYQGEYVGVTTLQPDHPAT